MTDENDFDFDPFTPQDRIGFIVDDLEAAADELSEADLEKLCAAIRKRLDAIDPGLPF
jgi:hypothetical protein